MWLLGAQEVTSIDLNRLLVLDAMKESILLVERTGLANILKAHVKSPASLRSRIDQIYAWAGSAQDALPEPIKYLAPFDILTDKLEAEVDLTFSVSTLEHIPRSLVGQFVQKMAAVMSRDGIGLHAVDLTDHFDSKDNPLAFLALTSEEYSDDSNADSRGNRIRGSEWLAVCRRSGLDAAIVMSSDASPGCLPTILASPFDMMDSADLLRTSVVLRTVKKQEAVRLRE
jgi:hypothetical protein